MKYGLITAAATDVFKSTQGLFRKMSTGLTGTAWIVFLCAAVAAGIMFAFGRNGSEIGKGMLIKVIIGVAIVALAMAIISTVASAGGANASF